MVAAAAGLRSGGHCFASEPAGRPRRLEIEAAGDTVDVQDFSGEKEARANSALHCFEIHFPQFDASTRHEFVLV